MKRVVEFASEKEFVHYRKCKAMRELGTGAEGTCYLGRDGIVYKDFTDGFDKFDYLLGDIILSGEVQNDSFIFPDVLFTVNGELVGLTMKYAGKNLISKELVDDDYLKDFDFDSLLDAYRKMRVDVDKLSDDKIMIFDLTANLVFDGKTLRAIDTVGYTRTNFDPREFNRECLDDAVKNIFFFLDECLYGDDKISLDLDVESYVRAIEKRYKERENATGGHQYYYY